VAVEWFLQAFGLKKAMIEISLLRIGRTEVNLIP
jgi:hypothetical protein